MRLGLTLIGGLLATGIAATSAIGEDKADPALMAAVKARQAHMSLYAFNIGILGAMAKGDVDYDAAVATAAADNLTALAQIDETRYWPPGTSDADLGADVTRALPAIWAESSTVADDMIALNDATVALQLAAGNGLDSLRGAIGPVGKACGACHENFRKPSN